MSIVDNDREESRAARNADNHDYVKINGQWYDADDVPDLADLNHGRPA